MNQAIRFYQYFAPAVLTPLSFYLWWGEYRNIPQVLMAWLVPVMWAYIVPAFGTNVFKVWEFDVRWKLGRFRPHHGFVFGSATAMLAWLVHGQPANNLFDILQSALIMCSLLGFWNLLYEIKALRVGLLKVYNQPWAEGRGEEAIAFDYAPWFFGGFGAAYGFSVGALEYGVSLYGLPGVEMATGCIMLSLMLCIVLPVLGYIRHSFKKHGHAGLRPATKEKI
jgi:hypothetical protein